MTDEHRPAGETAVSPAEAGPPTKTSGRRRFLKRAGLGLGMAVGATAWGYDPDWLAVRRHRVRIPGLEKALTAVQVSDLHADRRGSCSPRLRERVAEQVRREAPDVIFATGDFITQRGDSIGQAADWVAELPAREGTYAVLGNHDSLDVEAALRSRGVEVLTNAWTRLRGIAVAGVGDLTRGPHAPRTALGRIPRGTGTVLLAHQPDSFWAYAEPVTLQLSGHTHGGQATVFGGISVGRLAPPVMRAIANVPDLEHLAATKFLETRHGAWAGFFRRPDGSTLYVNAGLGRFRRVSFYCPPELTVWTLEPGEA